MSHPDLRTRLIAEADRGAPRASLDVADVIRRTRARRRPAVFGASALALVAVVGLGGLGVTVLGATPGTVLTTADEMSTADGAPAESGEALGLEGATRPADDTLLPCGSPVDDPALMPAAGLTLTLDVPSLVRLNEGPARGTLRLTNTGEIPLVDLLGAQAVVVIAQEGIVLGRSVDAMPLLSEPVDLAPGQSREFPLELNPRACTGDAGGEESLPPGEYTVSAVVMITTAGAGDDAAPALSPPDPLTLER